MVEKVLQLDSVFHSLSDPIRRDILHRLSGTELSISELAQKYDVSFEAVSKHVKVLQIASLVSKRKEGKRFMVALVPETLKEADEYLERYRLMWESRYDKLNLLFKKGE